MMCFWCTTSNNVTEFVGYEYMKEQQKSSGLSHEDAQHRN